MTVVAHVPDLMDRSRLQALLGDEVRFVAAAELPAAASGARLVVVDLGRPGVIEVLPALAEAGVRTVGFGAHVDAALLEAARQAGCTEVLPRSRVFHRLGDLAGPDEGTSRP